MESLSLDSSVASEAIQAVHKACASKVPLTRGPKLSCKIGGQEVADAVTICRELCQRGRPELLAGEKTDQLLASFNSFTKGASEAELGRLNDALQASTCLAGHNLSLADLLLFVALHDTIVKMLPCPNLPHVARWFDYVQQLPYFQTPRVPLRFPGLFDTEAAEVKLPPKENKTEPAKAKAKAEDSSAHSDASKQDDKAKAKEKPEDKGKKKDDKAKDAAKGNDKAKEGSSKDKEKKDNENADKEIPESKDAKKAKAVPVAQVLIGRLDVRVGKVLSISKHPSVDTMYVQQVDIGTGVIPVVSGVAAFVPESALLGRTVCVIVNLAAAPCKGVESAGRILCGTSEDGKTKEICYAPEGAKVGESLTWPGVENAFDDPMSSKNFSKLQKDLSVVDGRVLYRDLPFTSSAGVITLSTISNGTVA